MVRPRSREVVFNQGIVGGAEALQEVSFERFNLALDQFISLGDRKTEVLLQLVDRVSRAPG